MKLLIAVLSLTLFEAQTTFGAHPNVGLQMSPARQMPLFPRRAVVEFPNPQPGVDSLGMVEAEDGHLYYVKADAHGRAVRASEWIGTSLAEAVGISAPTPSLIEMADGSVVFGSRSVSGAANRILTALFLTQPTIGNLGQAPVAGLQAVTSAVYVFDMFGFNDDRHLGNFLSYDDAGTRRLHAFDFSRAFFWSWPWNGFPSVGSNTRVVGSLIRGAHGFDSVVANSTLDRLEALSPATIDGIFKSMPASWLSADIQGQFTSWWGAARSARVSELRKGINDGTLL